MEENVDANDSDDVAPPLAPVTVSNNDQNGRQSRAIDRATLKSGLQATAALANKTSTKKPTKATPKSPSSLATSVPLIATTEPSHVSASTSDTLPTTSPLPPNHPKFHSSSIDSPIDSVDFVPNTPLPTPLPIVEDPIDNSVVGVVTNGAAIEKVIDTTVASVENDIVMQEEDFSPGENSSDELLMDSTNSAMHN